MLTKKEQRLRRARQTRIRIATQGVARLTVNRTNLHIYASVISGDGGKVLATLPRPNSKFARLWVRRARVAMLPRPRSLASVWLKKPRLPVSRKSHLIVQVLRTTAASKRWLMQHVKLACSSKQIGIQNG
jgi:ribosomal protein L18